MSKNKICFLVCPIGLEDSPERKRSDQLLNHIIAPKCEELGYDVIRADKINDNDTITQTILEYLQNSDLVIADITDSNPNVFYELGYRQSTNKPVIQMVSNDCSVIPFDVSSVRTIKYTLNDPDKLSETKQQLHNTIETIVQKTVIASSDTSESNLSSALTIIANKMVEIDNSLSYLQELVTKKDQETMKLVAETVATTSNRQSTLEDKMTSSFLETMFKNPQGLKELITVMESLPKKN